MSNASTDCLANAKVNAVVVLVKCVRTSNASADCLADAMDDATVALVECAWMSELAKRSAGVRICQVK